MSERHAPIVESPDWQLCWPNEAATEAFAQALARGLMQWPEGADATIALHGDLGAGKTTWVRHLLRACGVQGRIKSPTYAVVEPHVGQRQGQDWPIWHFDFYRFADPQEWEDAGFRDLFAGPGLKLMEWPERVADRLPTPDVSLHLSVQADGQRWVRWRAGTPRARPWAIALGLEPWRGA